MFMGVESVRKHETGLECDQRLSRKMRIKVAAHGEERSWRFKIAVSKARGGMFLAFAGD
jgi:hypothetical protein